MKCFKCRKNEGTILLPSLQKKACPGCFGRIIEKRFSKKIREMGIREAKLTMTRPSDKVLAYLFRKKGMRTDSGKRINQETLDDKAVNALKSFFLNRNFYNYEKSPLESISEEELAAYAKINNLEFRENPRSGEDKRIHDLLIELEKRRPGVMHSIRAFLEKLKGAGD